MESKPPSDPDKTLPRFNPTATQEIKPVPPVQESEITREYHPDIMQFIDILNWETYQIMGPDGYIRTGLKIKSLEKQGSVWMVTLFNPEAPDSANDTFTMTLGAFEKERARVVVDTPRVFSETETK